MLLGRHCPGASSAVQSLIIPLTLATSLSRANGLDMISIPGSIPLAYRYTLSITSQEQDLEVRTPLPRCVGKLPPIDAPGQADIS